MAMSSLFTALLFGVGLLPDGGGRGVMAVVLLLGPPRLGPVMFEATAGLACVRLTGLSLDSISWS